MARLHLERIGVKLTKLSKKRSTTSASLLSSADPDVSIIEQDCPISCAH